MPSRSNKTFNHTHTVVIETLCTRAEIPVEAWPIDDGVVFYYTAQNVAHNQQADYYALNGTLYWYCDDQVTDYPVLQPWKICRKGFEHVCMPIRVNMQMAAA